MTILNIYSLDDTENQNIIACLPEGKHIIGRGDLLKVTDKRVSRKHAVIEVSNGRVALTSVHINPCFFKAANGKTLIVITQNQESLLNDGDQFALLPESCWFKVKIKNEEQMNGQPNVIDIPSELNGKRIHEDILDTTENSDPKRARTSTSHETSVGSLNNIATTSKITTEITTNYAGLNETSPNFEYHITSFQENNEEHNTSLNLATTKVNGDGGSESESVDKEIKEEPENNSPEPSTSINVSQNSPSNEIINNVVLSQEVKEEPLEDASNNENLPNDTTNDQPVVKRETDDIENGNDNENHNDNENLPNSLSNEQPVIKTETNDSKNLADEASGSGTSNKKTRRERCWYAEKCFRKNPNHRETFSHPGDKDYDSDPDDDRPDCPYGTSCYRKNIEHRREYKHTGKPAPKQRPRSTSPSPPGSPTTQNKSPKQKRQQKRTPKKPKPQYDQETPEDDYDFEDPFINDGSSDDFQPSDDGIDSDSSDWEDTQDVEESQERKRMLKEAKKFAKQGKKK